MSEIEKETKKETTNQSNSNDTTLEVQLGDVIHVTYPLNETLNEQTFIIDYIDKSKLYLINSDTFERIRLSISEDGTIGDGNITRISILSRSETPSYAQQNGLLPGVWVNIYFEGDFPVIITGEITNLENDMIELSTIDNDIIYLNFDYKGIPEDLPIEMIEIREKPSHPLTEQYGEQYGQEELDVPMVEEEQEEQEEQEIEPHHAKSRPDQDLPALGRENQYVNPATIQISVPVKNIKDQIREFIVKADQVKFGDEEFGPIVQYVDVASKSQRYSIETQVSDLLDELLSTIPNAQRTPKVLNNIHVMIERFKQLREQFSHFDKYGNIEAAVVKEATFKPLTSYFRQFKTNLYWILPIVKNVKKVYDVENIYDENNDIININLNGDIKNMKEVIENYKSTHISSDQNNYATFYSDINPYFTPFELVEDEKTMGIIHEKAVMENINTIIDNLEEFYSSIFNANAVRSRRFVIQKYSTSLTKLDTVESTSSKTVTVRTNIQSNEVMSVKSFMTLPEPVIRFSKINLPGTSILEKANLNTTFLNYWQLLKKTTNVHTNFVDSLANEIEFNEQNFANNIKHFALNLTEEETRGMSRQEIYDNFVKVIIPKTKVLFNLMKKYITGKLSIVDVVSYLEPFLIYADDLTYMQYREIVEFIDHQISKYNKDFIEKSRVFKSIGQKRLNSHIVPSKAFSVVNLLNKTLIKEVIEDGYDMYNPTQLFTNSEILRKIAIKDYTKLYTTAISVQSFPLMFPSEFSTLFEEEKNKLDGKLQKEETNDKCKTVTISKYYTSLEDLMADDDKTIYFDKKYDKTNYGLLEEQYGKELLTMSLEDLHSHITRDLIMKKKLSETEAEYQSTTLIDGHKKVLDGQFAILYKGFKENVADEMDFYIRKNNKWVIDADVSKQDINTDEPTLLCDIQKECISITDSYGERCENLKTNELGLQTKLLKDVISEFDTRYKMTKEEFQKNVTDKFD